MTYNLSWSPCVSSLKVFGGQKLRSLCFLELRHCLGHEGLKILNPPAVRRMRRSKLRRLGPACGTHPFPEGDRFMWIVTGAGHVEQAHFIGFGFMLATERQDD